MMKERHSILMRAAALLLVLLQLFSLAACGKDEPAEETTVPTELAAPAETEPAHTHVFADGLCECGQGNGFENVTLEADSASVTREDTESSMVILSDEPDAALGLKTQAEAVRGQYYEQTYVFTSDAAEKARFVCDGVLLADGEEYDVEAGQNEIAVRFAADEVPDAQAEMKLDLGGLGAFTLTFTEISVHDADAPHVHSFVNGLCECGVSNGFAGVNVWTDGSLTPATREDTASSMIVKSTNAASDWWKVKVEPGFALEKGKTYEAAFVFTSDVSGTIKFNVDGASYDGADTYNVQAGANTFTVKFTVGESTYHCLELGGLGAFTLTFTGMSAHVI